MRPAGTLGQDQAGPLKRGASHRRREDDHEDHLGRSTILRQHAETLMIDRGENSEPGDDAKKEIPLDGRD